MSLWQSFKSLLIRWFYPKPNPSSPSKLPTSPTPPTSSTPSTSAQPASGDYEKAYVEHLRHLYDDIKGFFIPRSFAPKLEDIFVQPQLALFSANSPTQDPDSSQNIGHHSNTVWEWMNELDVLWVIGRPGSGKTTLLSHMTLRLSTRLSSTGLSPEEPRPHQLPILLSLRHHRQEINDNPTYTLAEAAQNGLIIHQINNPPPANWFSEQLKKGLCLVMMDGLDEVPDSQRQGVANWIQQQIKAYDNNHFIVTSRALDPDLLSGLTVLEIQPFSNQQVQGFVERWYLAYEHHVPGMKGQAEAEALISLISEPAQKMLASNPLLLTMMVSYHSHLRRTAHLSEPVLPRRRVDLYAKVCEIGLNGPEQEFDLTASQKLRLLQPLAYQMMKHHRSSIDLDEARQALYVPLDLISGNPKVADFLQRIERRSGLLQQNGEYAFAQRTFQEYMTALYVAEQGLEKELMNAVRFEDSWWHETIYLYSTYSDASPIMTAFLRHETLSLPMLRLATDCMEQPGEVELEVQNRWEKILQESVEDSEPARRRLMAQGLLSLRLKRLVPINENLYVADSLIRNAEYQLFSKTQTAKQLTPPPHWSKGDFPAGSGLEPVSGIGSADAVAFCQWLTERDREGFLYRLPTIGEFNPLLSETAYWAFIPKEQVYKLEHEASEEISLAALEHRLRLALSSDLVHNGNLARERMLALSYDLEQVREQTRALALACDFTYDRAHHYTINPPNELNTKKAANFEHTRMAKFVTERLLRILRPDSSSPASQNVSLEQQQAKQIKASEMTLAEQYFKLHHDLQRLQKRTNDASPASGGIRIVAYRPAVRRPAPVEENKSRRSKAKARSRASRQHKQVKPQPTTSKQTRMIQKKICILGDTNVGKTSLLRRFVEGHFDERYLSTVGVNILRKTLERPSYTMNMVLWEIEGGHGFKKAHLEYLHGVAGAIIVCDLTRHETLATLERYADQLRTLNAAASFVIVGNKVDLVTQRAITYEQLNAVSHKLGCPYLLTSAKTGTQVNDGFRLLADQIERRR